MKFSIIIPVYKVEQYLRQCVDSVLAQSFKDFEVILVDDGSPDGSPAICDEYAMADNRVKVIHKKNGGLSSARNAGLEICQGDYVAFIDSDDWWCDEACLEKVANTIISEDSDIVLLGKKKFFPQTNTFSSETVLPAMPSTIVSKEDKIKFLMTRNLYVACAWDKVVRRPYVNDNSIRFVVGQKSEDIEWSLRLLLSNPEVSSINSAVYVYRQQNPNSITSNIGEENIEHIKRVISKFANSTQNIALNHFLANQYVLLVTLSNKSAYANHDLKEIKSLWWLIEYNWYPYVRLVSKIRMLGFHVTRFLLGCYYNQKRKR